MSGYVAQREAPVKWPGLRATIGNLPDRTASRTAERPRAAKKTLWIAPLRAPLNARALRSGAIYGFTIPHFMAKSTNPVLLLMPNFSTRLSR